MKRKARLILSNGTEFCGWSFGYAGEPRQTGDGLLEGGINSDVVGEVVFNTAMTGYPESLTDPSYAGQILVTTFPLIGNYGVPDTGMGSDGLPLYMESDRIHPKALVVADYSENYSHWNAKESLSAWLKREKIPAITGIDTRRLTKVLREHGVMMGRIVFDEMRNVKGEMRNDALSDYGSINWVEKVSCKEVIRYNEGAGKRVVLVDCGVKANIIRCLIRRGVEVIRVPWDYDFNQLAVRRFKSCVSSRRRADKYFVLRRLPRLSVGKHRYRVPAQVGNGVGNPVRAGFPDGTERICVNDSEILCLYPSDGQTVGRVFSGAEIIVG